MDDPVLVGGFKCLCNLLGDGQSLIKGNWSLCDSVTKGWSVDQFENEGFGAAGFF